MLVPKHRNYQELATDGGLCLWYVSKYASSAVIFPSTFSDWGWESRTICNGGEITEVRLGFFWRNTASWVAHIWPVSVTPVGWRIYGLCLWHQLGCASMTCVCDTRFVAQIWPVSVTPDGWRIYGLCLWHRLGGANMTCFFDTSWVAQIWPVSVKPDMWRKHDLCLWHQLCGANMVCVCDTRWVEQIWPVSVTPVGWRKCGPCLWHQICGANIICLWHQLGGANVTLVSDTSSLDRPICRSQSGHRICVRWADKSCSVNSGNELT